MGLSCPSDLRSLVGGWAGWGDRKISWESLGCLLLSVQPDPAFCSSPEKLDVVPIEPHTVFLGIHGGKLCLSCVKSGDETRLQLEVRTHLR